MIYLERITKENEIIGAMIDSFKIVSGSMLMIKYCSNSGGNTAREIHGNNHWSATITSPSSSIKIEWDKDGKMIGVHRGSYKYAE